MAIPTTGSQGFNGAEFRDAIHFVMQMGAPVDADEQATFYFPSATSTTAPADGQHVPFDPAASVSVSTPDPVKVDCAIEYQDSDGKATRTGIRPASRVAITLLDVDHAQVEGCEYVVVGGDRFDYRRTEPPEGLFDVGLYVMHFFAENQT